MTFCYLVGALCFAFGLSTQAATAQVIQGQGRYTVPQGTVQPGTFQRGNVQWQEQGVPQPIYQQPGVPNYQPAPQQRPYPVYQNPQQGTGWQTIPQIPNAAPPAAVVSDDTKKALEAERAAYEAAKIKVKKLGEEANALLEKNKALVASNEGVRDQFESLEQENTGLKQRMKDLGQTNEQMQVTVSGLEEKLAELGKQDPGAMQNAENLRLQYQESVKQNDELQTKTELLANENDDFRKRIAELAAAQEKQMTPDANPDSELTQRNLALDQQNTTLTQQNQSLSQQNQSLVEENRILGEQSQVTLGENKTLTGRIAELSTSNEGYAAQIAQLQPAATLETIQPAETVQPTVDVSGFETKIAQLTRKNRQLTQSNSDFEGENRLLNKQLAKLEKRSGEAVDLGEAKSFKAVSLNSGSEALATVAPIESLGTNPSKWGVLSWLIPFLALGLGIAFFVILREEVQRPSGSAVSSSRKAIADREARAAKETRDARHDSDDRDNRR